MTGIKPYPPPMEYHPDEDYGDAEIRCRGDLIGMVYGADDFPCLDGQDVDYDTLQEEVNATGRKLVEAYNLHDDLVAALTNILDAYDANDSHGIREEIERSRAVVARAKGGQ